jgi:hypothetical protein
MTLDTQKPAGTRLRCPCRANPSDPSADEQKKKRRRLRQVPSLGRDVGTSVPDAEEVPATEFTDADPNGCPESVADPNGGAACVANVDDEEGENEVPLTRKNSRQFIAAVKVAEFPLLLCLLSLVCKNCLWPILIRLSRIWFRRICYRSQQMMVRWRFELMCLMLG